jgi:hypothetical protein
MVLKRVNEFNLDKADKTKDEIGSFFRKLLKLNLWGNRNDLSISLGVEIASENDGNPIEEVENMNDYLVVDQTEDIWKCISDPNKSNNLIDIVNDNAAYELMCDLILADFILEHHLADRVRFHVKAIPWFISDVTPTDLAWSLEQLVNSSNEILKNAGLKWTKYFDEQKFYLVEPPHHFWTSGLEYHKMKDVDPGLYELLSQSHLAFFKGDLNYRKLLGDLKWDTTVDFQIALQGFRPTNLCSLRTVKADLICGLNPGQSDQLYETDLKWMATGKYGVIQFAPK